MKNLLGMITLALLVSCGAPQKPGMTMEEQLNEMQTCDQNKNTVRSILTGDQEINCSSIISSSLTAAEGQEKLEETVWTKQDRSVIVTIRNNKFWTVQVFTDSEGNDKVLALRGNLTLTGRDGDALNIETVLIDEENLEFGRISNEDVRFTDNGLEIPNSEGIEIFKPLSEVSQDGDNALIGDWSDENITIVTSNDDIMEFFTNL